MKPTSSPNHVLLAATLLALLALPLAGCIGGTSEPVETAGDLNNSSNVSLENRTENNTIIWDKGTPIDENSTIHTHDYWSGQKEVTIVQNDPLRWFTEKEVADACYQQLGCLGQRGVKEWNIPIDETADRPKYVYPGTGRMEVTLTWTGEPVQDVEPVMCVRNDAGLVTADCILEGATVSRDNATGHAFNRSGETWTIASDRMLNEWTWDVPHTLKSRWRFAILAEHCPLKTTIGKDFPGANRCEPATGIESFEVTIKIFRNEENLPVNPPHFDYFQGRSSVTVLPETELDADDHPSIYGPGFGDCSTPDQVNTDPFTDWYRSEVYPTAGLGEPDRVPLCVFDGTLIRRIFLEEDGESPVIPPGTKEVQVALSWEHENPDQAPVDLRLAYRNAVHNWATPWVLASTDAASCDGNACTYSLPAGTKEADSLYARKSVWEFAVFADHGDADYPVQGLRTWASIEAHEEVDAT